MNTTTGKITVMIAAFLFGSLSGIARPGQAPGDPPVPVLTVLYDNYSFADGCAAAWGFSALIQGLEKTILFDTGTSADIFLKNARALSVDFSKVDLVVISHDHGDHTGGLPAFLKTRSGIPVYVPAGANARFQASVGENGGRAVAVQEPVTLFPGVLSTGDVGEAIHEHALILDTPKGLIVVTGCAHPGIVRILEKAKEIGKKDIWMVLGGFHLVRTPPADVEKIIARFKELGVKRVGATHCTGDAAIAMFRKAFGPDFVEMGVGRKINMGTDRPL
jgi:7,8-dihydropterin-6-yl-methyl-4-(beta-D-ribofuranosyl)aminobenzene 5'-phosphate synthase